MTEQERMELVQNVRRIAEEITSLRQLCDACRMIAENVQAQHPGKEFYFRACEACGERLRIIDNTFLEYRIDTDHDAEEAREMLEA